MIVQAIAQPMMRWADTKTLRMMRVASREKAIRAAEPAVTWTSRRSAAEPPGRPSSAVVYDSMAERPETVEGERRAAGRRRPPFVAQLDLASFGAFVGGLLIALALIAVFRSSPSTVTKVAVGIIFPSPSPSTPS